MEESAETGGREGGGGKGRAKDVTMLRIDHSDVYIENERLNEDLSHTIDTLHRSRYQKVMSRDTEINKLKQSLIAMRKISNRGNSHLQRSKSAGSAQKLKEKMCNSNKKNITINTKIKDTKEPVGDKRGASRHSTSTPPALKSIEVRMPPTKMNSKINEEGSDDEGTDSDSSADDDDDDDDNDEDENDSSCEDTLDYADSRNKNQEQNHRPRSIMSRNISSASLVAKRNHKNNNQSNRTKHGDPLTRIMSRLNLDKLPPSWYTEVVPASDVYISRRAFKDKNNNSTMNSNKRSNIFSKKSRSRGTPNIRPATTGGDIFRQESKLPMHRQKSQINLQQRPFTSAGIRSVGEDNNIMQRSKSRAGMFSNLKSGDEMERSQSVLFCEQANHGSKTMRQLKEEEMQTAATFNTYSTIDILLEEVKEERKVIDRKVRSFVKSLEEKKRSERLKRFMSESNLIKTTPSW